MLALAPWEPPEAYGRWNTMRLSTLAVGAAVLLLPSIALSKNPAVSVHDSFSNAKQLAPYGVDRSEPLATEIVKKDGGKCLQLTVGHDHGNPDPFYNFQGYVRYADDGHTEPLELPMGARVAVSIYVPEEWQGDVVRGADLWVRIDDPAETVGYDAYPTAGFYNYADGQGTAFSIFEPYSGDIVDVYDAGIEYGAWNDVEIVWEAEGVAFYCNGERLHVDDAPEYATGLALEAVFLQGWRASGLEEDYDIWFDDMKAHK
jgi:hypothetical protein